MGNINKIIIQTLKRHPIACPHGQTMGCLLCIVWRIMTLLQQQSINFFFIPYLISQMHLSSLHCLLYSPRLNPSQDICPGITSSWGFSDRKSLSLMPNWSIFCYKTNTYDVLYNRTIQLDNISYSDFPKWQIFILQLKLNIMSSQLIKDDCFLNQTSVGFE